MQPPTLPNYAKPGPYFGLLWLLQNKPKEKLGKSSDAK